MSVLGLERSATVTDQYDHAISLVDSTKPQTEPTGADLEPTASGAPASRVPTDTFSLGSHFTKGRLRQEIARRKYAKWQENKGVEDAQPSVEEDGGESGDQPAPSRKGTDITISEVKRKGRLRDRIPFGQKPKRSRKVNASNGFIEVLYENQRGFFACGIPVYSSNSLLNFDPAAWQTSTFENSAVDIYNAQVPDPSWRWDWKKWYVDMSYDVDEDGWQYSLNFGTAFAWHGNHPWFHSFVRRRRWLRKRIKRDSTQLVSDQDNDLKGAHALRADYFTIHNAQYSGSSRGSSADRSTNPRSSFAANRDLESKQDEESRDIEDIPTLMAAIKKAVVDRERVMAVEEFLQNGREELFYLADAMPTILQELIHPTSRSQLEQILQSKLKDATGSADGAGQSHEEHKQEAARLENLRRSLDAFHQAMAKLGLDDYVAAPPSEFIARLEDETPTAEQEQSEKGSNESGREKSRGLKIKGISKDAQVGEEPHIGFSSPTEPSMGDKGKSKAG